MAYPLCVPLCLVRLLAFKKKIYYNPCIDVIFSSVCFDMCFQITSICERLVTNTVCMWLLPIVCFQMIYQIRFSWENHATIITSIRCNTCMYPWMFNEIATLWKKPCNNGYTNTVYPQYVLFCVITAHFSLQRTSHVGYTDMVYSQ